MKICFLFVLALISGSDVSFISSLFVTGSMLGLLVIITWSSLVVVYESTNTSTLLVTVRSVERMYYLGSPFAVFLVFC